MFAAKQKNKDPARGLTGSLNVSKQDAAQRRDASPAVLFRRTARAVSMVVS
jgi:hypothetical protein